MHIWKLDRFLPFKYQTCPVFGSLYLHLTGRWVWLKEFQALHVHYSGTIKIQILDTCIPDSVAFLYSNGLIMCLDGPFEYQTFLNHRMPSFSQDWECTFEIWTKSSGYWTVRFSNGWDYSYLKPDHLKTWPFEIWPSKSLDFKCLQI